VLLVAELKRLLELDVTEAIVDGEIAEGAIAGGHLG
jgi:hypothetical protein